MNCTATSGKHVVNIKVHLQVEATFIFMRKVLSTQAYSGWFFISGGSIGFWPSIREVSAVLNV